MVDIEKIKKEIVERLIPIDPIKIILFGSFATGNPNPDSDIDLYIVTNDNTVPQNYTEKIHYQLKIAKLLRDFQKLVPIDIIVHTRKMHEQFITYKGHMCEDIMQKGIVLYEKKPL